MSLPLPDDWSRFLQAGTDTILAMVHQLPHVHTARQAYACSLLARARNQVGGAHLLLRTGLVSEAATLARSSIETVIFLQALQQDAGLLEKLKAAEQRSVKNLMDYWLDIGTGNPEARALMAEKSAELSTVLAAYAGRDMGISLENLARRHGQQNLYTAYRELSNTASHPSVSSIERGFVLNQNEGVINLGTMQPDDHERLLGTLLHTLSCTIWTCIGYMRDLAPHSLPEPDMTALQGMAQGLTRFRFR